MDAYTAGSVARMTQVNARTLDYWSSTGFLIPSVARSVGRRGRRRLYGFADIIAVLVARDLRQSGVSLQGIRRIVAYVQQHWDKNETLAGLRLFVVGKDVSIVTQGEIVSALRRPGQRYLDFSVWDLQGRVESARKAISMEKSSSASERRSVRKSKVARVLQVSDDIVRAARRSLDDDEPPELPTPAGLRVPRRRRRLPLCHIWPRCNPVFCEVLWRTPSPS